jgi:ABC-type lipoprotein release transport system permease subunit
MLIALGGGSAMAAWASSRRIATADDRLIEASNPPHAFVFAADEPTFDRVTTGPDVEVASGFEQLGLQPVGVGCTEAPSDYFQVRASRGGRPFATPKPRLIHGRYADPAVPGEAVLSEQHARRVGVGVGDHVRFRAFGVDEDSGELAGCRGPVVATVEVVGIIREYFEVGARDEPTVAATYLTPAFRHAHPEVPVISGGVVGMVRLRPGRSPEDYVAHVAALAPTDEDGSPRAGALVAEDASLTKAPLAALAIGMLGLAVVLAAVTAVTAGVSIVRQIGRAGRDLRMLSELGLPRPALATAAVAPVLLAISVGMSAAIGLALALSPLALIGLARQVDPATGFDVDGRVLLFGTVAGSVVLLLTAAAAGLLAAVRAGRPDPQSSQARRTLVDRIADRGAPPAVGLGLRFALGGSGRGGRNAPTRAVGAALAVAVAGLVGVLWFGTGVRHASQDPSVYGWGDWDAFASPIGTESPDRRTVEAAALADPGIDRVSALLVRYQLVVAGRQLTGFVAEPVQGRSGPTVVDGRLPAGPHEIALGEEAAGRVGVRLGDPVAVSGPRRDADLAVVGFVATPSIDGGPIVTGFVVDLAAVRALGWGPGCRADVSEDCFETTAVSFGRGTDPAAVERRLQHDHVRLDWPKPSADVILISQADAIPGWASIALAVVAALGLGHALLATVSRRRRDLAIMRALGLDRRRVGLVIVTEAMVLGLLGAVAGGLIGVVAGRAAWAAAARAVGIGGDLPLPAGVVIGVTGGVLVLAAAVSVLPAVLAGRSVPADGLRAEA